MSQTVSQRLDEAQRTKVETESVSSEESSFYQCVRCHSKVEQLEETSLRCDVCDAFYPSIDDVKIFVSNPDQSLKKQTEWIPEKRKEIEGLLAKVKSSYDEELHAPQSLARMEASYQGMLANLDLIEEKMEPVRQYLN